MCITRVMWHSSQTLKIQSNFLNFCFFNLHYMICLLFVIYYQGKTGTICRVNIGTTHFVNAVIQRRHLTPVAVVRLCGTATKSLKPFVDFPEDLKKVLM